MLFALISICTIPKDPLDFLGYRPIATKSLKTHSRCVIPGLLSYINYLDKQNQGKWRIIFTLEIWTRYWIYTRNEQNKSMEKN